MSNYTAVGTIVAVMEKQDITDKFSKREFVLETMSDDGKYTNQVLFQTVGKNMVQLDKVRLGDKVEVAFNVRGRAVERGGKTSYYNALDAWKITKQ